MEQDTWLKIRISSSLKDELSKKYCKGMSRAVRDMIVRDLGLGLCFDNRKEISKDVKLDGVIGWKARLEEQILKKKSKTASGNK